MRVGEIAKRLDVSVSLVYNLLTEGKLRGTRHGLKRGTWRISEDQLAEYLESCQAEPKYEDGPLTHIT
jgi:excisionase family DNA binding protein